MLRLARLHIISTSNNAAEVLCRRCCRILCQIIQTVGEMSEFKGEPRPSPPPPGSQYCRQLGTAGRNKSSPEINVSFVCFLFVNSLNFPQVQFSSDKAIVTLDHGRAVTARCSSCSRGWPWWRSSSTSSTACTWRAPARTRRTCGGGPASTAARSGHTER